MKLVIIGQKWLATQLLNMCVESKHRVVKVICPPGDRLSQRARELRIEAREGHGPVASDSVPECDLILSAHAHCFITGSARAKSLHGALGYHPSLLPRHRGRDSIRWAVHMREAITGGTLYWMDNGADTGPIALQDWCHIQPEDDATSLWRRELAPMGLRLFERALAILSAGGRLPVVEQCQKLATWEPGFAVRRLSAMRD